MPEPFPQFADGCRYERQDDRPRCSRRRHQLLLGIWLSCSAFTWPGRVPQLSYDAAHASVPERVEALRSLEGYPSQASSDACLAGLEDRASEVRTQAAVCSGALAEARATTNLLDLVAAKEATERTAALEALGRLAPARALPSIEQALSDPQPAVRVAAARALTLYVRQGSFEIGKVAALLSSDQVEIRLAAVELLEESPARLPLQLRAAARDRTVEVRVAAQRAMGHARITQLLPDLQSGLSDPDETVRLSAIAALGDCQLAGALTPLRTLVSTQTTDVRAARTALAALGRSDDPSALNALAPALTRPALAQSAVSALAARARRLHDTETLRLSADALQHAIDATLNQKRPTNKPAPGNAVVQAASENSDATLDALAHGLIELAAYGDMQKAVGSLTQALEAGLGEVYALTQQLIALRAPQLVPALLARQARSATEELPRLADALMSAIESSSDAPGLIAVQREKLQQFTGTSSSVTQLHALLHVTEADGSVEQRRALAELWAKLPSLAADRERSEQLVRWLDDADPRVRDWSSVALGRSADTTALAALAERLKRGAAHPELSLQACAGAILRASQSPETIPSVLRERLLQHFQTYLTQPDETVALSALFALRASHDQRSALWIAELLRGSSAPLRAAAVQALGDFDQPEARRMLRDMLRGDNLQNASNAALALAELGSDRDVEALLRAAERGSWPLPPSAAYAAARITQRGATRKHSLERVLCRFTQLRDSYVLTNSVSALAALGADACDEQTSPRALLEPALPSPLRVAAALWLQSTRPHTPEETTERAALLARCATDHDRAVATACGPQPPTAEIPGQTLLRLSAPDGQTALRSRMVALRLPDASVFIGQSDSAGRVLLPRVLSGVIQLEDPADQGTIALPARVSAPASP